MGGVLVYSTCSVEAEENGDRARAFLAAHPNFELDPPAEGLLPPAVVRPPPSSSACCCFCRIDPRRVRCRCVAMRLTTAHCQCEVAIPIIVDHALSQREHRQSDSGLWPYGYARTYIVLLYVCLCV